MLACALLLSRLWAGGFFFLFSVLFDGIEVKKCFRLSFLFFFFFSDGAVEIK
jgi:hypothetical protein